MSNPAAIRANQSELREALRVRHGGRCEAPHQLAGPRSDPDDRRCAITDAGDPACARCKGEGWFYAKEGDQGACKLADGSFVIPCDSCLGYGRIVEKPAEKLRPYRLRGAPGETDPADVICLCGVCAAELDAKPELKPTLILVGGSWTKTGSPAIC